MITYTVDPAQSTINWNAKKVGGQHDGSLRMAKGQFGVEANKLIGGEFTADMTTLRDTDKGDTNPFHERLVSHLRGDDFFAVEKYPTSTFKITGVKPIGGAQAGEPNYTVSGDLTTKGTAADKIIEDTFTLTLKIMANKTPLQVYFPTILF